MQLRARLREPANQRVRRRHGEQLPQQTGLPRETLGRCSHPAALGVAQQGREVGGPRKADPHRMFETEIAQMRDPLHDRLRVETELADDMDRHPGGLGRANLVSQCTIEVLLQYAWMAVGIAGDADLADAMT